MSVIGVGLFFVPNSADLISVSLCTSAQVPEVVSRPPELRDDQVSELSASARLFLLRLAQIAFSECERPMRSESDSSSEVLVETVCFVRSSSVLKRRYIAFRCGCLSVPELSSAILCRCGVLTNAVFMPVVDIITGGALYHQRGAAQHTQRDDQRRSLRGSLAGYT